MKLLLSIIAILITTHSFSQEWNSKKMKENVKETMIKDLKLIYNLSVKIKDIEINYGEYIGYPQQVKMAQGESNGMASINVWQCTYQYTNSVKIVYIISDPRQSNNIIKKSKIIKKVSDEFDLTSCNEKEKNAIHECQEALKKRSSDNYEAIEVIEFYKIRDYYYGDEKPEKIPQVKISEYIYSDDRLTNIHEQTDFTINNN